MSDENSTLMPNEYTKQDYTLALILILVNFGEAIECYLPGVITQYVSCEIGVSKLQEAFLGCTFFLTLVIGTLSGGTFASQIGERKLLLASLYLSCISTVICAVVANYMTLLLARTLIGFCVGLSFICNTFVARFSSTPDIKEKILFA